MKVSKDMTVNEVLKRWPQTMKVFSRYNIDICCGGGKSLEESARKKRLDVQEVVGGLNEAIGGRL